MKGEAVTKDTSLGTDPISFQLILMVKRNTGKKFAKPEMQFLWGEPNADGRCRGPVCSVFDGCVLRSRTEDYLQQPMMSISSIGEC